MRQKNPIILAIDTSTDYLSLALLKGDHIAAKFHVKADRRHSILLVPTIQKLLKKAKIKIGNIDCFAISAGPGSFTGLRIGVTVVKGLAYALKKPIVSVPTMDVIADNAKSFSGIICPVLDARKNKVYACIYRSNGKTLKKISKYMLLPLDELLKKLSRYDKALLLGDLIPIPGPGPGMVIPGPGPGMVKFEKDWHPKAEVVAGIGADYFNNKKFVDAMDLEPMYIYSRECDITGK